MNKIIRGILIAGIGLIMAGPVNAQSAGGYIIDSFNSQITIQKDTKLLINETIDVVFTEPRHGIYRYIPTIYRYNGKMTNAHIRVISVEDQLGKVGYTTGQKGNDFYVKIGDANKTISGFKKYILVYEVSNMITRWEDHDELYWNTAGSGWDTNIANIKVTVYSPFANITKTDCFAGELGRDVRKCVGAQHAAPVQSTDMVVPVQNKDIVDFRSMVPVGNGSDMTIVVGLDKNNQLVFPTLTSQIMDQIKLRWYYILVFIPAIVMGWVWWKKGRDITAEYDKYLPYVYAPIKGITPAQAGVLIDQRVNIADLTAEIIELARRKYIKINKLEKDDFEFVKLKPADEKLEDYQKYLLDNLKPKLSQMKEKFYKEYGKYKEMVSQNVASKGWFDGSPEKIRGKWVGLTTIIFFVAIWAMGSPGLIKDGWLMGTIILSGIICFVFALLMPRRTAQGHKLYHDLTGLKYYINEGKWRYENFEKNLFIEEVLPIAIALGVVTKLADQMKALGIQAPQYAAALGPNISGWGHFNAMANAGMAAPKSSGGWSGGSGFSGGSVGGGGGGGGGGSW